MSPAASSPVSQVPALREQICLNGVWADGDDVPNYPGAAVDVQTFRRDVRVPRAWENRRVALAFDALAYSAKVAIDGRQVADHVGAWLPFEVDVTGHARPGGSFDLSVEVAGMLREPTFVDGWERWPLGAQQLHGRFGGIVGDVFLRAFGEVYVADTFIRTSIRSGRIEADVTLVNVTDESRRVEVRSDVLDRDGTHRLTLTHPPLDVPAGGRKVVTLAVPWPDARLWFPHDPHLYHLRTSVHEGPLEVDAETRRFGFREVWTEGTQYRLNGVRLNVRGDYCGFGGYWPMEFQTRDNLGETYRHLKDDLGFNTLRWHMHPAPRYCYEIADEVGMMIVAESPVYGRPAGPMPAGVKKTYIQNSLDWLRRWVASLRNYPSIIQWSPINEMGPKYPHHQHLTADELRCFGAVTRELDPTRPILYHGNAEVVEDTQNWHYPLGGNFGTLQHDIESWQELLHPDVPTGVGEFLQTSYTAPARRYPRFVREAMAEWNRWLLGVWIRGLRYIEMADFRPKMFFWMLREVDTDRYTLSKNACQPVALFDHAYDKLGIAHLVDKIYPPLEDGTRRLVLFNDEFRGESVEAEVELRAGDVVLASVRRGFDVPLGGHLDLPLTVVTGGGDAFDLIRRTYKDGRLRFEEPTHFAGTTGTSHAPSVALGDPM